MKKITLKSNKTNGKLIAEDIRAAAIIKETNIDFCCGSMQSLGKACKEKAIDPNLIFDQLSKLKSRSTSPEQNFNDWDLAFLVDYIAIVHHRFVLKALPELLLHTQKIASVHAPNHPELLEIVKLFKKINKALLPHITSEETILFPAIKEASILNSKKAKATIETEILAMSNEHDLASAAMKRIHKITSNYSVPDDGCEMYKNTFNLMHQFEDDLHIHLHLENNILYAKALLLYFIISVRLFTLKISIRIDSSAYIKLSFFSQNDYFTNDVTICYLIE